MNLYRVYPREDDWSRYVFDTSRNNARARLVRYFDDSHEYLDFNAQLVQSNVGGGIEVCDTDCHRLEELGVRYAKEEEWE